MKRWMSPDIYLILEVGRRNKYCFSGLNSHYDISTLFMSLALLLIQISSLKLIRAI